MFDGRIKLLHAAEAQLAPHQQQQLLAAHLHSMAAHLHIMHATLYGLHQHLS